MNRIILIVLSIVLISCKSDKPDYILNETAFCSGIGTVEEEVVCNNSDKQKVTGLIIEYFPSGKKSRKFTVKNGIPNGRWEEFYENGKLIGEWMFKDGKLDGWQKEYYENGKLEKEFMYKDGKLDGWQKEYYENGKLKEEFMYRNGYYEGVKKIYHENGKYIIKMEN